MLKKKLTAAQRKRRDLKSLEHGPVIPPIKIRKARKISSKSGGMLVFISFLRSLVDYFYVGILRKLTVFWDAYKFAFVMVSREWNFSWFIGFIH